MNKTRTLTSILIGVFLLMLGACQPAQKKEDSSETEVEEKQERVKAPEQIISLEESKSLYDNYTRKRVDLIQDFETQQDPDSKFEASRFTAFDYATIKQYIAFIEQEADSAGVDISSLRFYFGNYPNKEKFPDGKRVVHPRQNSIFIVPTINVDGQDFGFYIGKDGKAQLIKDAVAEKGMGSTQSQGQKSYASFAPNFSTAATQTAGQSLNLNRGSSSPPPPGDF
ncbi:hypothetical protein GTQ34_14040 [Muricauda sp. JGD-17]|uniref:Uncharacterized protein n=1 Tax=Flagellimonas ochracea TaxID=2696472 RepID=A0A964WYB1_9FLAO|nr:hypothetical protein [Allomuricauda ochracea]NAY93041.1 hypothetical protein [Allomuricauda ochracea]